MATIITMRFIAICYIFLLEDEDVHDIFVPMGSQKIGGCQSKYKQMWAFFGKKWLWASNPWL